MSWDATLIDDRGHVDGDWNYTHNCNGMIAAAYHYVTDETIDQCGGPLGPAIGPAWWDRLNGMSGGEGQDYLAAIIRGLEADPARFRCMEPENKWGSYDSLLTVLREMRDRVPEWPTRWEASG